MLSPVPSLPPNVRKSFFGAACESGPGSADYRQASLSRLSAVSCPGTCMTLELSDERLSRGWILSEGMTSIWSTLRLVDLGSRRRKLQLCLLRTNASE